MPPPRPEPARSYALLSPEVKRHYLQYYKMTFDDPGRGPGTDQDGAARLDLRTKELIALGAALMTGAPNVLAGHLAKLRKLGVTEAQIHEAVAVALGVAGASVVDRGDVAEQLLRTQAAAKADREAAPVPPPVPRDSAKSAAPRRGRRAR